MVPGGFQVRGGRCLNAAEAKGSHKGCVHSGGEACAVGSHLTGASLILVELRSIHEAVHEVRFMKLLSS